MTTSPSKFQDSDVTKGVINSPRSQPLRINKDSHVIRKSPSNPSSPAKSHGQSPAKRQPVIIYTHSPKVIYARACNFMSIVQKLTGFTREEGGGDKAVKSPEDSVKEEDSFSDVKDCGNVNNNVGFVENNETASGLSDDQLYMGNVNQDSNIVSPMYEMSNTYLVDAPLYAPNPSEFFCSARPSSLFPPPNMTTFPDF